jgi:LysR family glycine cleavage system transcriptional activator
MQIPSLQTLRALDAAARHGSYTGAAAELGLTHGAISHRLRALEDSLGYALFTRDGNGMRPTQEALRLLVPIREALDRLAAAFPGHSDQQRVLRVSLLPSMASRWLIPRVAQFRSANPVIDLRIDARLEFAPLTAGGVDCAIRYGSGDWPDVHVVDLGQELLFPVCTPAYREKIGIRQPADLMRANLLRHDRQSWRTWLDAAQVEGIEPVQGALFSDTNLMLDAAVAGEGIALARSRIVAGDIASGRLVKLFDIAVKDRYSYYFVRQHRLDPARRRAIECFASWVQEQFRTS